MCYWIKRDATGNFQVPCHWLIFVSWYQRRSRSWLSVETFLTIRHAIFRGDTKYLHVEYGKIPFELSIKMFITLQRGLSLTLSLTKQSFAQLVIYKLPSNINVAISWPRDRRPPELLLHRVRSVFLAFLIFRQTFSPHMAGNFCKRRTICLAQYLVCAGYQLKRRRIFKWGRIH